MDDEEMFSSIDMMMENFRKHQSTGVKVSVDTNEDSADFDLSGDEEAGLHEEEEEEDVDDSWQTND